MNARWEALRKAAQGLLKLIGHGKGGPFKPDPGGTYNERVEATFAALAALEEPARSTGGSTMPGAMTPEFVHARSVAVAIDRIRGGDAPEEVERDYGFPGGMLAGVHPAPSEAPDQAAIMEHIARTGAAPMIVPEAPDREALVAEVAALRAATKCGCGRDLGRGRCAVCDNDE